MIADFGIGRAFIKIYSQHRAERVYYFFGRLYFSIAVFVTIAMSAYLFLNPILPQRYSILAFPLAFSLFFDGYLYCCKKALPLHLSDSLFFILFYCACIGELLFYCEEIFYIILFVIISANLILKYNLSCAPPLMSIKLLKRCKRLNRQQKSELSASIRSMVSVGLYKQVERIFIMTLFPPQLFAIYQIIFSAVSKFYSAGAIFSRQYLALVSSASESKRLSSHIRKMLIFTVCVGFAISVSTYIISLYYSNSAAEIIVALLVTMFTISTTGQLLRAQIIGVVGGASLLKGDWAAAVLAAANLTLISLLSTPVEYLLSGSVLYYSIIYLFSLKIIRDYSLLDWRIPLVSITISLALVNLFISSSFGW